MNIIKANGFKAKDFKALGRELQQKFNLTVPETTAILNNRAEEILKILEKREELQMKTWEMIKELMEHPEKKFKSISDRYGDRVAFANDFECIVQEDKYGNAIPSIVIHREWEEVKEPVDFMEVVKNGGLFTVKHKLFHSSNAFDEINLKEFAEELCDEFTHAEIKQILLEGKFYIEDQEVKHLDNLQQQLRQAEQNFNYADENHIDAAIYEMKAVEEKFSAILKEKKEGEVNG